VLHLVVADLGRERLGVARQAADLAQRLVVERRLEVLERKREVQDVDVAAAVLSDRLAHERADGSEAVDRARRDRAARDERLAAQSLYVDGRQLGGHQLLVRHGAFLSPERGPTRGRA
jgi:hypothetical protein